MKLASMSRIGSMRKRVIIIGASGLLILLVAGYTFWSMNTWGGYTTTYESWQKQLRSSVDTAIALPTTTTQEKAKKLVALKGILSNVTSAQQSLCRVPAPITWQHVIQDLRHKEEACTQVIANASAFGSKIQAVTGYLENEESIAKTIQKALSVSESMVTETTWNSQTATWQGVEKTLNKLSTTAAFAPVKTDVIEKVKALDSSWQEVIAAHVAKDKAKYTDAQNKLTTAYTALSSLSNVSNEHFTPLTTSLQLAYMELFDLKA